MVTVVLSAKVKRLSVFRMRDFFLSRSVLGNFLKRSGKYKKTSLNIKLINLKQKIYILKIKEEKKTLKISKNSRFEEKK